MPLVGSGRAVAPGRAPGGDRATDRGRTSDGGRSGRVHRLESGVGGRVVGCRGPSSAGTRPWFEPSSRTGLRRRDRGSGQKSREGSNRPSTAGLGARTAGGHAATIGSKFERFRFDRPAARPACADTYADTASPREAALARSAGAMGRSVVIGITARRIGERSDLTRRLHINSFARMWDVHKGARCRLMSAFRHQWTGLSGGRLGHPECRFAVGYRLTRVTCPPQPHCFTYS